MYEKVLLHFPEPFYYKRNMYDVFNICYVYKQYCLGKLWHRTQNLGGMLVNGSYGIYFPKFMGLPLWTWKALISFIAWQQAPHKIGWHGWPLHLQKESQDYFLRSRQKLWFLWNILNLFWLSNSNSIYIAGLSLLGFQIKLMVFCLTYTKKDRNWKKCKMHTVRIFEVWQSTKLKSAKTC